MAKTDACSMDLLIVVLISFLHATFMKIGENNSAHELARMLQASSKFDFIFYFFILMIYTYKLLKAFPPKFL